MADVQLEGVTRSFGDTVAVSDLSLDIRDGEFVVLLGPTGVTGREVARHLHRRAAELGLTWGVAGRDRDRIRASLDAVGAEPAEILVADTGEDGVTLRWEGDADHRWYAVYRVPADTDACALADAKHLVAVLGGDQHTYRDPAPGNEAVRYHVTAVDAFRVESVPSAGVVVNPR